MLQTGQQGNEFENYLATTFICLCSFLPQPFSGTREISETKLVAVDGGPRDVDNKSANKLQLAAVDDGTRRSYVPYRPIKTAHKRLGPLSRALYISTTLHHSSQGCVVFKRRTAVTPAARRTRVGEAPPVCRTIPSRHIHVVFTASPSLRV